MNSLRCAHHTDKPYRFFSTCFCYRKPGASCKSGAAVPALRRCREPARCSRAACLAAARDTSLMAVRSATNVHGSRNKSTQVHRAASINHHKGSTGFTNSNKTAIAAKSCLSGGEPAYFPAMDLIGANTIRLSFARLPTSVVRQRSSTVRRSSKTATAHLTSTPSDRR